MVVLPGSSPEAIRRAAEVIERGGLVAFPTETVYGLGADAFQPRAVAAIFEIKGRPRFDPLIVHVADPRDVVRLWLEVDPRARRLMERFWPGPLTLVLPKRPEVPEIVTAGLRTVAVRMPAHPVALELIREAQTPIAAPSANPFGRLSPTTAEHVLEGLGDRVEVILDGGRCPVGVESTVLALDGEARLLRPGGVPVEEIEEVGSRWGFWPSAAPSRGPLKSWRSSPLQGTSVRPPPGSSRRCTGSIRRALTSS